MNSNESKILGAIIADAPDGTYIDFYERLDCDIQDNYLNHAYISGDIEIAYRSPPRGRLQITITSSGEFVGELILALNLIQQNEGRNK